MLQIGFRWDGEGVNIAVAIELFAGGDAARMVPKVTDLQCSGVIRVLLAPLCPEIPCFGAAVVALRSVLAFWHALLCSCAWPDLQPLAGLHVFCLCLETGSAAKLKAAGVVSLIRARG